MTCGADTLANTLLTSLTAGVDFTLPDVDLTDPSFTITDTVLDPPVSLTNADLTQGIPGTGTGTFDVVMKSLLAHLGTEYEKGRITGAEYSKVYIEGVQAALGNSVQFLLGRDQAYWQAVAAQMQARIAEAQAVKARVDLETAKAQLMATIFEAKNQEASYALTKMQLSTASVAFCSAEYNLANILPEQKMMLHEQMEAARAQTWDARQDGLGTVVGSIGKQKDLYTQQIESYKRDAEVKAAKLFTDAWITQKTIDEGLVPPTNFANTSLDAILADLKTNNALG
jgi:hypothetical protein